MIMIIIMIKFVYVFFTFFKAVQDGSPFLGGYAKVLQQLYFSGGFSSFWVFF